MKKNFSNIDGDRMSAIAEAKTAFDEVNTAAVTYTDAKIHYTWAMAEAKSAAGGLGAYAIGTFNDAEKAAETLATRTHAFDQACDDWVKARVACGACGLSFEKLMALLEN